MIPPRKILFVHEGKAAYPELKAYSTFFADHFETEEVAPEALCAQNFSTPTILWFLMGFYPQDPSRGAAKIVHDYRSLSIGRLAGAKDWVKRRFNARPSLRIFQNDALRQAMGFRDKTPSLLLPMGVPELCLAHRVPAEKKVDFCYIGALSAERQSERMIDSFWRRFGASKSFVLYGEPEPTLRARYADRPTIRFAGKKPQDELFSLLPEVRCAVNAFPNHFPHFLQTPTKLLEYAALGLRILSNEHPSSRAACKAYGIQTLWGPADDLFRDAPEALAWPDNAALDPTPFLWPSVIRASGIEAALEGL